MPEDEVGGGETGKSENGDDLGHQPRQDQQVDPSEAGDQQQRAGDEGPGPADDVAGADGRAFPEVLIECGLNRRNTDLLQA